MVKYLIGEKETAHSLTSKVVIGDLGNGSGQAA